MTPFLVSATSSFPSSLLLPALNRYRDVLSIVPHNLFTIGYPIEDTKAE